MAVTIKPSTLPFVSCSYSSAAHPGLRQQPHRDDNQDHHLKLANALSHTLQHAHNIVTLSQSHTHSYTLPDSHSHGLTLSALAPPHRHK